MKLAHELRRRHKVADAAWRQLRPMCVLRPWDARWWTAWVLLTRSGEGDRSVQEAASVSNEQLCVLEQRAMAGARIQDELSVGYAL